MVHEPKHQHRGGVIIRGLVSLVICTGIVIGSLWLTRSINDSEPEAEMEGVTRRSAALVDTIAARIGEYRPTLRVLGVVEPAEDIVLSPRVSGEVRHVAGGFTPGGIVNAGDHLVSIDRADYEASLAIRTAERLQIEADLAIEQGRQDVALREFELLGEEIDETNRSLILREPQIASIRARLDAAIAAEQRAELDLDRTSVSSPIHGQILERSASVGSQVGSGSSLARIVGVDEYWVLAGVPMKDLRWIDFNESDPGVRIKHVSAWGKDAYRVGSADRVIGEVDELTRMARVLVLVEDPLALATDGPRMMLGSIVELEIPALHIQNAFRIERSLVRRDDTVWVLQDGVLDIRTVSVIFRDDNYAYINDGLTDGDRIVTNTLASVVNGTPLRERNASDENTDRASEGVSP